MAQKQSVPLPLRIAKNVITILRFVAPPLAVRAAARTFRTPPRTRPVAHTFTVEAMGHAVHASSLGDGPAVILLHGWGGWPGQLDGFRGELLARGYRVVTLSPIAHGGSGGRVSSLIEFTASIEAVAARIGEVHAVIAHSLGGIAAALAARQGLAVRRLVLIGSPAHPRTFFDRWLDFLGFPASLRSRAYAYIEEQLRFGWDALDVAAWGPALHVPLLAIHDAGDRDVACSDSVDIVAHVPNARLITTHGLGHRRILDDPEVIRAAVDFVTTAARQPADVPLAAAR